MRNLLIPGIKIVSHAFTGGTSGNHQTELPGKSLHFAIRISFFLLWWCNIKRSALKLVIFLFWGLLYWMLMTNSSFLKVTFAWYTFSYSFTLNLVVPLYLKCVSVSKAKKTINKMKRQLTDWEKIFANNATDKGLIYKIYKQLNYKLKKTQKTQSKNGQKM